MKQIVLSNNKGVALVDDADYSYLMGYKWHLCISRKGSCYAIRSLYNNGKSSSISMHSQIYGFAEPVDRDRSSGRNTIIIDHINENGLDNRRGNLRLCTRKLNSHNRSRPGTASGYLGVTKSSTPNKWISQVTHEGKKYYLGTFDCRHEAGAVALAKKQELYGDFCPDTIGDGSPEACKNYKGVVNVN